MKKLFSILGLGLALLSCRKEDDGPVNVITDHVIPSAGAVQLTALDESAAVWSTDRRLFELAFSGNGTSFKTTLVGYAYALAPGQYVLTPAADARIGDAVLENTSADGKSVTAGYVTVMLRDGTYTVSADVTPAGSDENVRLYYEGPIDYAPDPDPVVLTQLFSAQSNLSSGSASVTLQLGTDGISSEFDMGTFTTVWKGEGGYLALDLYSADGYLHEGVYYPSAEGGVIGAGEFGIGWDPGDIYGWGFEFTDWGTCWWTVSNGTAVAGKITSGIISVSRNNDDWTISWGSQYPLEYVFTGAIPALTQPEMSADFEYAYTEGELTDCADENGTVYPEVQKHSITIVDAAGMAVAYFEPVIAAGVTDLEGSYLSTEYAHEAGTLANGYFMDFSDWGWGIIEGGSWYMKDGEKVYIDPGVRVEIVKLAAGAYEFKGNDFAYRAAGPDYVPGGGSSDASPSGYTAELAVEAVSIFDWGTFETTDYPEVKKYSFTVSDPDGNAVAAFVAINATGTETPALAGAYTIQGDPHEAWLMDNGWVVPDFGMAGGTWFTDERGAQRYVSGGTVKIAVDDYNGTKLYTFSAQNVQTIDASGADAGTGSFEIPFVTLK